MEAEPNITLKLNAHFLRPLMEDNKIIGVVVEEGGQEQAHRGMRIIDAVSYTHLDVYKRQVHPIKTFSIGFYDKEEDEAPFAREIAKYLHTDHTEMYADENIMLQQLEDIAPVSYTHLDVYKRQYLYIG